jgi:hypothetical protein
LDLHELRTPANLERVTMNALVRDPSAAAERMRLHRERRRQGLRCLMIELRETEIDVLIEKGLLGGEMRNDPDAVCDVLYTHLDQTLGSTS